ITDREARVKKIIFHPRMLPEIVIGDPELTLGLPKHITAATGMDALSHNLEAFFAPFYHPLARGIADTGIAVGAATTSTPRLSLRSFCSARSAGTAARSTAS
ncbi:MAG: iron-containing alcohol dehydrogenase, partial [Chloroflexi bacterium]|nr:iron-containing alcohol dehydrogenase [Chloroflexota bacterium]